MRKVGFHNVGSRDLRGKFASAASRRARPSKSVKGALEGKLFEEFVKELSASFARVPVADIGAEIDRWIREIVLGHDLDRGALAQIDPKSNQLIVRHSWSRDDMIKLPVGMELARSAPWFDHTLMSGRTLVFSKVKELMPEFEVDLKTFRRYFPKSNVTVPLRIDGETVGAVGFATLRKERSWSPRMVRRMQLVAEVFGNALERRRAAEENALLRHELAHISRTAVMGELTASVAHQLNQPMAAILSNAEAIQSMLESEPLDRDELRAAANDIVQDDLRATEIIKGLHALFRKNQVEKMPVDLKELVDEVIRMVRSDALFRNVSLKFEAPEARLRVAGDRIQLQQAIMNLILNAFDAISNGSKTRKVTVMIIADGDQNRLAIRDSGKGIEPATISRMFEPFFTTKPGGMGMGLSIARSIVKAHSGYLSATRNPDCGSTFEISLPAINKRTVA
ncbi:MAG TPA: ATP-binding protein [Candidatus Binataceae bacterium]|nr:ATP-binding protein [Candidatus Binataceae bacterium]